MLLRSKNLKNVPETNLKKSKLQFQVSAVFSQKKENFSPLQENLLDIVQIKKKNTVYGRLMSNGWMF